MDARFVPPPRNAMDICADHQRTVEQLEAIQRIAHIGLWEMRMPEGRLTWSEELFRILDVAPEQFDGSPESYLSRVHPGDKQKMLEVLEASRKGELVANVEHRIVRRNGEVRHVSGSAQLLENDDGWVFYGTVQDVTEQRKAAENLHRLANRLTVTLESITDGFFTLDTDWRFSYVNGEAVRLLRKLHSEILGARISEVLPDMAGTAFERELRRAAKIREAIQFEEFYPPLEKWLEIRIYPSEEGLAIYISDITERRNMQESLRISEERFKYAAKASSDAIWDWNIQEDRAWRSENIETQFGLRADEPDNALAPWVNRLHPADKERVLRDMAAAIDGSDEYWSTEYRMLRHDQPTYADVLARCFIIRDSAGKAMRMIGALIDMTERKSSEQKIRYLAFHDSLTGLPNRTLLSERLSQCLLVQSRRHHAGAVLLLDLDDFKTLNDTYGYETGNLLLKQVAERLLSSVRKTDTVARLGGDEFVVLIDEIEADDRVEAADHVNRLGDKILTAFCQPFSISDQHTAFITASIGVALFGNEEKAAQDVLKRAELAMYHAKADGRNILHFFDPHMEKAVSARVALEADLRKALLEKQFRLYYQPQISAEGHLIGVEALLRWPHPVRGMISPVEFIPLTEKTGLILQLGQWVLETACDVLQRWSGMPECAQLTMAVNVSVVQLRTAGFVEQVLDSLSQNGANPTRLKIELTESILIDNVEDSIEKMTALKSHGVHFALDDFGTGYSSLSYLKLLPLAQLKIDRSFVRDILVDQNDAAIARTIIALGKSLGLGVIAEGVENEGQRNFLMTHHCSAYQGFLFSRPLPLDELESFARKMSEA